MKRVDARSGRDFLRERGFDGAAAAHFGVGFAPRGGDELARHLRGRGFTEEELTLGGLCARGSRGLYDKFRGRLLWPIRDITGSTVGFGARRIFDDDRMSAKYLNTAETPIYKKSQVLYGLDLAKKAPAVARPLASTTSRCCDGSCATRPTRHRRVSSSPLTVTRPGRRRR
jgi:DNA primase